MTRCTGLEPWLPSMRSLRTVDISENAFTGTHLVPLHRFPVTGPARIVGFLPWSIGNLSLLASFNAIDNRLNGSLPASLQQCSALTLLKLGYNALTGRQ